MYFGNQLANTSHYQLLDTGNLELKTPPGNLSTVDVRVELSDGQTDVLESAYRYQQPIQSEMLTESMVTAMAIDPSATYMMVGSGNQFSIFNIDPSQWTASNTYINESGVEVTRDPLNPDDLRRFVDINGDGIDDRQVFTWNLPGGYIVLGVKGYFERGNDFVYITAAQPDSESEVGFKDSKLFILAVDDSFESSQLIRQLELPGDIARGIIVENNQALVAAGTAGMGVVDVYLPSKAYLMESANVKGDLPALDLARTEQFSVGQPIYAVVSGEWTYPSMTLSSN